ncbi:MAG: dolichol-phosphate mannosyltransferase [Gammaproteobacteria bacterium]|jgi:dolichol-phosphate mannosyltransferase
MFPRVRAIIDVLARIPLAIRDIFCVDDGCLDRTEAFVGEHCKDPRVKVLFSPHNEGVGGATRRGFFARTRMGADIVVKLDGDGQMDPRLITGLVAPILDDRVDYTKGNRFFSLENVMAMPRHRHALSVKHVFPTLLQK